MRRNKCNSRRNGRKRVEHGLKFFNDLGYRLTGKRNLRIGYAKDLYQNFIRKLTSNRFLNISNVANAFNNLIYKLTGRRNLRIGYAANIFKKFFRKRQGHNKLSFRDIAKGIFEIIIQAISYCFFMLIYAIGLIIGIVILLSLIHI